MQFKVSPRTFMSLTVVSVVLFVTLFFQQRYASHPQNNHTKLVLIFTSLWNQKFQISTVDSNCPYKCEYINDKRRLREADAVLFHGLSMDLFPVNAMLLSPRPPELWDQIWIFKLNESPLSYPDARLLPYKNTFNWTMTYRRDSDIYAPKGEFMPKRRARRPFQFIPLDLDDESLRRRKLVVSMISNCNPANQRLQYISLMKHYTAVDDYGACGTLQCAKKANYLDCYAQFGKQYKFFLAFENSFCADYVTEKAFEPFRHGMVPVVRGGGNYSEIFPKGSYVDTQDFKTVRDLVEYLKYLDNNHIEYRKYFEWRETYDINSDQECELCSKIHKFNVERDRKSYPNIYSWYHTNYSTQSLCTDPPVMIL